MVYVYNVFLVIMWFEMVLCLLEMFVGEDWLVCGMDVIVFDLICGDGIV